MRKLILLVTFSITGFFFLQLAIAAENSPQQEELAPELVTTNGGASVDSDVEADGEDLILEEVKDNLEESPFQYEPSVQVQVIREVDYKMPVDI